MDGIYINRESGARARVEAVDDYYARLIIESPGGKTSRYSMPIADYDGTSPDTRRHFSSLWRTATPEDLIPEPNENFRPPANEEREPEDARVSISPELDD